MKVQLHHYTADAELEIVRIARVSSSRKDKDQDYVGLIKYLIKNKHWSPFEHATFTFEIETSKAIAIQLLRHRSFSFQEFSQRYQDVTKVADNMFQPIELRKQATNNRQSSTEEFNPMIKTLSEKHSWFANGVVDEALTNIKDIYNNLLKAGVARECARMILPMCTTTVLHMTGNIRSWLHFLEVRNDEHAQKEAREIAFAVNDILIGHIPNTMMAFTEMLNHQKMLKKIDFNGMSQEDIEQAILLFGEHNAGNLIIKEDGIEPQVFIDELNK